MQFLATSDAKLAKSDAAVLASKEAVEEAAAIEKQCTEQLEAAALERSVGISFVGDFVGRPDSIPLLQSYHRT